MKKAPVNDFSNFEDDEDEIEEEDSESEDGVELAIPIKVKGGSSKPKSKEFGAIASMLFLGQRSKRK
jgi:hypothetical protein